MVNVNLEKNKCLGSVSQKGHQEGNSDLSDSLRIRKTGFRKDKQELVSTADYLHSDLTRAQIVWHN